MLELHGMRKSRQPVPELLDQHDIVGMGEWRLTGTGQYDDGIYLKEDSEVAKEIMENLEKQEKLPNTLTFKQKKITVRSTIDNYFTTKTNEYFVPNVF